MSDGVWSDKESPAALFVDYDNTLSGLCDVAAEQFARWPSRWLAWLEELLRKADGPCGSSPLLIRKCFLNPCNTRIGGDRGPLVATARKFLVRAGFSVIDCPSLTGQGKNGADIRMTMEALDAVRHETRFARFVIMSGDSDFTSVLLRLRELNRRTLVITSRPIAQAYRGAADQVIDLEQFAAEGLRVPGGFRLCEFTSKAEAAIRA